MDIHAPKFVIATDCDDVLVNTAGKWVRHILSDDSIVSQIPEENLKKVLQAHPMNREEFDITTHFGGGDWLTESLKKKMLDKYFHDATFYDDLNPSVYAAGLIGMAQAGIVESIWVITSCVDLKYPVTASKVVFLNRLFGELKMTVPVHYVFTEKGETKADAIKAKDIRYNSFVDDHLSNIIDVVKNTPSEGKEFLIPRYRYNSVLPEVGPGFFDKRSVLWFDNDMILKPDQKLYDRVHRHDDFSKFRLNWNV